MLNCRIALVAAALAAVLAVGACSSTAPQRTPPVGNLPDPLALVPAEQLAALFGGAPLTEPQCRYAESNYRCTWADAGNAGRTLSVTIDAESERAAQQIATHGGSSGFTIGPATEGAVVTTDTEVQVWAVVGERGLHASFVPADGNPAAHEAALVALAGALAAAMAGR
jgi:hypothetical protein